MNVGEVLESAAYQIDRFGWYQGSGFGDGTMSLCALQGIAVALGMRRVDCYPGKNFGNDRFYGPVTGQLQEDAVAFLGAMLPPYKNPLDPLIKDEPHRRVFHYNDAPERTQAEVTSLLRSAAALWKAQHQVSEHSHQEKVAEIT